MQAGRFRVWKLTVHALFFGMVAAATEATYSSVLRAFNNPFGVFFSSRCGCGSDDGQRDGGGGAWHSIGNRTFLFQNVVEFLDVVLTWGDRRVLLTRHTKIKC